MLGQVNNDFFPNSTSESIGKIVNLVHDNETKICKEITIRVKHVAEHFSGHHHNASTGIDICIPGENADIFSTPFLNKLIVFLVRKGLHGGCVEQLV